MYAVSFGGDLKWIGTSTISYLAVPAPKRATGKGKKKRPIGARRTRTTQNTVSEHKKRPSQNSVMDVFPFDRKYQYEVLKECFNPSAYLNKRISVPQIFEKSRFHYIITFSNTLSKCGGGALLWLTAIKSCFTC